MNGRPDPDRANHAADDDIWRDLVARLRADDPRLGPGFADEEFGPAPMEPSAAERAAAVRELEQAEDDAQTPNFEEFDPFGLARPRGKAFHDDEPEGDGEFVPEEPEPILAGADPAVVLAWLGALGSPVGLLLSALFWRDIPAWAIAVLVAAFIGSVGYLIMRLPREKDEDDDGARL
ncbi:hypothetical protein [Sinomonas terrae]|uniref:Uncharacterized protein n=1 Tax=Sinomonas terrae TaxID=2908838 RepID=A0ABS9U2M1_9MICC|nr:hypothetical protein [Sinomonas terrae]MCH6470652.1 hypothetical protein [Sinomonas terrae]